MTRGGFLKSCLLGSTGLAAQRKRPNVLFLTVDDLRPELGIYGASHVRSPNLDALGRTGMVFTRAYCQQAVCNPSRASVLTGLRPDTLRVWDLKTGFRETKPDAITLPQHFRQSGYHTVNSGKLFHNVLPDPVSWSEPEMRIDGYPFDPDAVYRDADQVEWLEQRKTQIRKQGQEQQHIDRYGQWYLKSGAYEAPDVPDNAYYDGAQTDAAILKLSELKRRKQPFFFGVGYYRPHLPFNAPKKSFSSQERSADGWEYESRTAWISRLLQRTATRSRHLERRAGEAIAPWVLRVSELCGRSNWATARSTGSAALGGEHNRRVVGRPWMETWRAQWLGKDDELRSRYESAPDDSGTRLSRWTTL